MYLKLSVTSCICVLLFFSGCSFEVDLDKKIEKAYRDMATLEQQKADTRAPDLYKQAKANLEKAVEDYGNSDYLSAEDYLSQVDQNIKAAKNVVNMALSQDWDQDSILNAWDMAPYEAEDIDGFEDWDGVPDPDNDHDKIPDVADLAPNEPETYNGYQDTDGKPDVNAADVRITQMQKAAKTDNKMASQVTQLKKEFQDALISPNKMVLKKNEATSASTTFILKTIHFDFASRELNPESKTALTTLANHLKKNQAISLKIEGFTDNVGSSNYNLTLSQQRAKAVQDFLVTSGIETARIKCYGYGAANPISSNLSASGRAKNRRIEFTFTEMVAGMNE